MCVAAARAIAASEPVVPHTPQLEPAENRRAGVFGTICTEGRNRTLTTFGRRVLDSMASMSAASIHDALAIQQTGSQRLIFARGSHGGAE